MQPVVAKAKSAENVAFSERFKQSLALNPGLTLKRLASELGISYEMVRRYHNGLARPTTSRAERLSRLLDVSAAWFLTGEGNARGTISSRARKNSHHASDAEPRAYGEATRLLKEQEGLTTLQVATEDGAVPLIDWGTIGARAPMKEEVVALAKAWLWCPVAHGPRTFVAKWQGNSMEPSYPDGSELFVDPDAPPRHNSLVIAALPTGERVFRQLHITPEGRRLVALNAATPRAVIEVVDGTRIIGKVIYVGQTPAE